MSTRPLKCLYALALYLFILELLYPFTFLSQSHYAELLTAHTKFLSLTLEVGVVYLVHFINSWVAATALLLPFLLNKTLRMRLKYLAVRAAGLEAIEKANAYPILFFVLLLNGMVFNREEGRRAIVWSALTQYSEIYSGQSFVSLVMLVSMFLWGVLCCMSVVVRGVSRPDLTNSEKGLLDPDPSTDLTIIDKWLMLGSFFLVHHYMIVIVVLLVSRLLDLLFHLYT